MTLPAGTQIVESPPILGPRVVQFSLELLDDARADGFDDIDWPAHLHAAVPKRRLQFAAGRYCAQRAIQQLTGTHGRIGRDAGGAPVWPPGTIGSITHTGAFVSAAAALTRDLTGIGIDAEEIMPAWRADRVRSIVLRPDEIARGAGAGLGSAEWTTLAFSAKEALFKCLHPLVRARFSYEDAELIHIDARRAVRLALVRALGPRFPAGTVVPGRVHVGDRYIHAGVWIEAGGGLATR